MENNNLNPLNQDNLGNKVEKEIKFDIPTRKSNFLEKNRLAQQSADAARNKASIDLLKDQNYNNFQLWDDAKSLNRVIPALDQYRKENDFKVDEDFMVDTTLLQDSKVPLQYWKEFNGVSSKDQFDFILGNLNTELETRERMSRQSGVKSFAFEMAATVTDPVQLAIGVATGGMSGLARGGSIASKLGTSYLVGSAEGAIVGSLINQGLHTYTGMDVVMESIVGGFLNSAFTGVGIGIGRGLDARNANIKEMQDAREIANAKKLAKNTEEGNDVDFNKEVDVQKSVSDYAQSHEALSYRRALEEEYYNSDAMMQVVDTWKKQNFKSLKQIETTENKIAQLEEIFEDMSDTGDINGIVSVQNSIFKQQEKLRGLQEVSNKQTDELRAYESLEPIEQMQYISDKKDEIFAGLGMDNPQLKSQLDMNEMIDNLQISEINNLTELKAQVKKQDDIISEKVSKREDIPAQAFDELESLKLKLDEQEAKVTKFSDSKPTVETIVDTKDDSTFGNKSVGAAQVKGEQIDYDSYGQKYEEYDYEAKGTRTEKVEQEIFDGVHNNINRLPETLKWLSTIQESYNKQGGKAALFGDLLFGRIATHQDTAGLQKKYFRDEWKNPALKKQVNQYRKELNEVTGRNVPEQEALNLLGKELHRTNLENISDAEMLVAAKYNKATKQAFNKYNANRKLSVESNKNMLQKQFGSRFQNILEETIDGKISLAGAYKNHFKNSATRNSGGSAARNNMNVMLKMYGMDKEQFNKAFPNISDELTSALGRSDTALKLLYKDIAQEAINSGADQSGMLKNLLDSGAEYNGSTQWNGSLFDYASNEFGNDQIIKLFKEAIESANPNSKFTKSVKKKLDDGTLDESEAVVSGKPLSEIYAEAIVNHTIRRNRNRDVTGKELEDGFELAMNDIEKFVRENETDFKDILDSDDFASLKSHINAEKKAAADKTGVQKFASKKIEIDYFHQNKMTNSVSEETNVSIHDFMEMNAERNMMNYLNTSTSHIAFAKNDINSIEDLQDLLRDIRIQANTMRDNAAAKDATPEDKLVAKNALSEADLKFAEEVAMSLWKGTSMIDYNNPANKALQYMGNFNFMRMMGKMGISQFSEWSEIAHQSGISTLFKSVPELLKLKKTFRNAKGDEIETLAESLESMGLINDQFNAQFYNEIGDESSLISFDNYSNPLKVGVEKVDHYKQVANDTFHKGSRFAGFIGSKMDKITRTMAVRAAFSELDKLSRMFMKDGDIDWLAKQNKNFTKRGINEDTLTEYGLTIDDMPIIKKAFDDYADFDVSTTTGNRIIKGLDLKTLSSKDPKAFDLLRTFAINAQNEVVAPATIGNSYKPLVNSQLMKTMFQFQTYGLQSLDHKVRHKFRTNNNVSMYLMLGAMTGFVSYSLNVLANAGKYENSDEYLADRFSMGKVLAGSFSRSVYAWYMPAILGSAESMAFDSQYFNESTRTSGLSQGIMSNPTTDLIDSAYNFGKYGARYAISQDENAYQQMMRNGLNVLPWASAPFIGEGAKVMAQSGRTYEKK